MTLFSVEAPPFESLDAALRFAYRIEWEGVYPQSQIGKLHIRWKPDLTLAERRAQASLITTHVRTRCTPVQRAMVECMYRMGPRRFASIHRIVRYLMAHVTGAALSQDLVRELVYRYFRSGMSYEAIAQSVGVDVRTVTRYNEKLWPLMLALNAGVMTLLEEQFRLAGVIP